MILKIGMQHRVLKLYKVCKTSDPGLTLNYFISRSNLVSCAFEKKTVTKYLNAKKLIFFFLNILTPEDCLALPRDYIHVYDHYSQSSFSLKPLGYSMPNIMWSLLGKREHKFCKNGLVHVTKMAARPRHG